jgi:hypothetical protein
MHRTVFLVVLVTFALVLGASSVQAGAGPFFGFAFKWLRDADGDGIPNHLDDDWVPPQDGTGYGKVQGGSFMIFVPSPERPTYERLTNLGDRLRDRDRLSDGSGGGVRGSIGR